MTCDLFLPQRRRNALADGLRADAQSLGNRTLGAEFAEKVDGLPAGIRAAPYEDCQELQQRLRLLGHRVVFPGDGNWGRTPRAAGSLDRLARVNECLPPALRRGGREFGSAYSEPHRPVLEPLQEQREADDCTGVGEHPLHLVARGPRQGAQEWIAVGRVATRPPRDVLLKLRDEVIARATPPLVGGDNEHTSRLNP